MTTHTYTIFGRKITLVYRHDVTQQRFVVVAPPRGDYPPRVVYCTGSIRKAGQRASYGDAVIDQVSQWVRLRGEWVAA